MILRWRSFCLVLWIGETEALSQTQHRSHAAEHAKFENFSNVKQSVKVKMKQHWDSMIEWHNDRGTIGKNIEMRRGPYGTGLFATGLIKKHAHILKIKPESLITSNTAIEVTLPRYFPKLSSHKWSIDNLAHDWRNRRRSKVGLRRHFKHLACSRK